MHALGLLRFMLSSLLGQRRAVTSDETATVELRCLDALQWRLGPFYGEQPMGGLDDERLAQILSYA